MNDTTDGEAATGRPGTERVSLLQRIPSDDGAPARARAVVERVAAGLPEELVDRATLAVSELVTNAVRHGSKPGQPIEIEVDRTARECSILVRDPGRPTPSEPDAAGGFGLRIVAEVADDLSIEHDPGWVVRAVFTHRRIPADS